MFTVKFHTLAIKRLPSPSSCRIYSTKKTSSCDGQHKLYMSLASQLPLQRRLLYRKIYYLEYGIRSLPIFSLSLWWEERPYWSGMWSIRNEDIALGPSLAQQSRAPSVWLTRMLTKLLRVLSDFHKASSTLRYCDSNCAVPLRTGRIHF